MERIVLRIFIISSLLIMILFTEILGITITKDPSIRRIGIERPQRKTIFFCGYCHVLTYPEVIKRAHNTWKKDEKHKDVGCVECHYPPDMPLIPEHRRIPKRKTLPSREFEAMKTEIEVMTRLVTILNMDEKVVMRKPPIADSSCIRCHPTDKPHTKEGAYWTKKLKFMEYERTTLDGKKEKVTIAFTHKEHYDKKKWVEGHELHCVTCHRKETEKKHFEVSKESCYLCHFKYTPSKDTGFAKGRADCTLCHRLPEEPFKKAEEGEAGTEKPLTHKDYKDRKIDCANCHLHQVKGRGEVAKEKCLDCHENSKDLWKDFKNKRVMHKEHVAKQTASCFNCHEPIEHRRLKHFTYIDASLESCRICHPNPHQYQAILLRGRGLEGIEGEFPVKHHEVNTLCISCHTKESHDKLGRKVRVFDEKSCIDCHEEKTPESLKKWKEEIESSLKEVKILETKVKEILEKIKPQITPKEHEEVWRRYRRAKQFINVVEGGGGIHNKKFAIMLLDIAMIELEEILVKYEKLVSSQK